MNSLPTSCASNVQAVTQHKALSRKNCALEQPTEERKFNIVMFGIDECAIGTSKHICRILTRRSSSCAVFTR